MTNESDQDMALAALLAAARDVDTLLPDSVIKASYAIQRRHQFNQDHTVSFHDLVRLVEDHVDQKQGEGS